MLCEKVTTVKRGTYIKKEVKNVPSQYKKFPPFENRLKTGYVLDLHSVHSAPDINFLFTVYNPDLKCLYHLCNISGLSSGWVP